MKNSIKFILFIFGISSNLLAQDLLNINNFNFKQENYNSSYIASDSSSLDISTIVSLSSAAQNSSKLHFLVYGNIGKHGLGLGAKVNTSFYQVFQSTTAEFLLAKKVQVGKKNSLSFAINGGVILNSLHLDNINAYTDRNDPVLINGTFDKTGFTGGMGMHYNWDDKINIGVSLPVLVQSIEGIAPVFFTNLSYKQKIANDFSIKPELIIYGPDYTTPSFEGNFTLAFKDFVWIKAGGRSTKSVVFGLGASVNFIDFGYMYNKVMGDPFNEVYNGMHSLNVAFHFLAKKPNKTKVVKQEEMMVDN